MGNGNPHTIRSWIGSIITIGVLLFIIVFAWRVVHYATLIQSGELAFEDVSFAQELSLSEKALAAPLPDGTFDLVSEGDPSLGIPGAKVTIVEFADFGCPYSRKSSFVMRALARKYGNQIHYVYRDFPIVELHPGADKAAEAGHCAMEQGKFWEYHDKLYLNQLDLSEGKLVALAGEINLDTEAFASCLTSGKYKEEVAEDYQDGLEAGVRGTPTFFINGNRIPGSIPEDVLDALIQNFLAS